MLVEHCVVSLGFPHSPAKPGRFSSLISVLSWGGGEKKKRLSALPL